MPGLGGLFNEAPEFQVGNTGMAEPPNPDPAVPIALFDLCIERSPLSPPLDPIESFAPPPPILLPLLEVEVSKAGIPSPSPNAEVLSLLDLSYELSRLF